MRSEDSLWKLTEAGRSKSKSIYSDSPVLNYLYEIDKGGGTASTGEISTNTGNTIIAVSASLKKYQRQGLVELIG